jgi:uncharacterized RDD family membrane protein YckC
MNDQEYAGFWIRTGAAIIDTILTLIIIAPILTAIYGAKYWDPDSDNIFSFQGGWDIFFSEIFPAMVIIALWVYKSATPGKMATKLTIVDAETGAKPSTGQFLIRYLGYYIATIPLFLGILWVAFDKRKQGWHDKLAGTVVIKSNLTEPVKFARSK